MKPSEMTSRTRLTVAIIASCLIWAATVAIGSTLILATHSHIIEVIGFVLMVIVTNYFFTMLSALRMRRFDIKHERSN